MEKALINQYLRPLKPLPTALSPRGQLRHSIKCILFDIYGTLFISGSGDINISAPTSPPDGRIKQLVAKYGLDHPPENIIAKFHASIEARHAVLRSQGVDYPEVIIEEIWRQVLKIDDMARIRQFAIEFELIANPVCPMPNLESMLSACRQKNLPMGIISNAQFYTPMLFSWFLHGEMAHWGFDPDLCFFSYQHGVAKPSLTLFQRAADRLDTIGIQPLSVLYVGNDMLKDIYPARRIGFQTALFAGDRRSLRLRDDDARCINLQPDLVITDLGQIAHLL